MNQMEQSEPNNTQYKIVFDFPNFPSEIHCSVCYFILSKENECKFRKALTMFPSQTYL